MSRLLVISIMVAAVHALVPLRSPAQLKFEAEDVSGPSSAWQTNKSSVAHWNLWSTDQDAAQKWSGGVVLQGPLVKADRAAPEDGAPPLHVRIAGLTNGLYDIELKVVRTLGVSFDGREWRRFTGGLLECGHAVRNGVVEFWVDDRFADTRNPGAGYFDTVTLTPQPVIVPKPKVEGPARRRVEERLDRGLVALPCADGVYVGWRLLKSDAPDVAFHVYRAAAGTPPERLSAEPVARTTDFVDTKAPANVDLAYSVRAVVAGAEQPPEGLPAITRRDPDAAPTGRFTLPLAGKVTFQKCGVGDLDGDGRLDYVIKQPHDNIDPWKVYWKPSPDTYKLEAYNAGGRFMWRIDLGWAIERGIWYSPFLVYDLDGDGRAEVVAKTGEGDPRDADGRVTSGPEWLTVFDGRTGREITRAPWPDRSGFGEGDTGYNHASRNQLAVAYLDGRTPCLIALRGTYTTMKAEAHALAEGRLRPLWSYRDAEAGRKYRGQGGHFTHCADIDGDGRDEVLLGSAVLDDNGSPLWSTGLGHPDHFFVGDLMPQRTGLEIYYGLETAQRKNGMCMVDAGTGAILWGWTNATKHIHSIGLCADISPLHPGVESYGADSANHKATGDRWMWASDGTLLESTTDLGFGCASAYWDADLQRELVRGSRLLDYEGGTVGPKLEGRGPVLVADLFGDWREELVVPEAGELRLYTTTIPAMDRRVTLLQDPPYRLDVAMDAMGYTLTPTLSCDLESLAPNLNLTALAATPGVVRIVVVAARAAPLAGALRLAAEGATISPETVDVQLAPGSRQTWTCTVKGPAGKAVRVRATLRHEQGLLTGETFIAR